MKRRFAWLALILTPSIVWLVYSEDGKLFLKHSDVSIPVKSEIIEVEFPETKNVAPKPPAPTIKVPQLLVTIVSPPDGLLPAGLVIVNANGKKTGFDSIHNISYKEIPNSNFVRDQGKDMLSVLIKPALTTRYTVEITGHRPGQYVFRLAAATPELNSTDAKYGGEIFPNTIDRYYIDMNHVPQYHRKIKHFKNANTRDLSMELRRFNLFFKGPETEVVGVKLDSMKEICDYAEAGLRKEATAKLVRTEGFTNVYGKQLAECRLKSTGSLKTASGKWNFNFLYAKKGSKLFYRGWQVGMDAGGPDGNGYEIDNGNINCQIYESSDGEHIDGDELDIPAKNYSRTVTCLEKNKG